jgi:hypothetical protein
MRGKSGILRVLCLSAALASAVAGTACFHHSHRMYDPYYNDYHRWDDHEIDYYHRWANETHRDSNRDFRKLPQDEQEEYWKWRHNQDDHHHGHDHH